MPALLSAVRHSYAILLANCQAVFNKTCYNTTATFPCVAKHAASCCAPQPQPAVMLMTCCHSKPGCDVV
jgi:hypothetical protein